MRSNFIEKYDFKMKLTWIYLEMVTDTKYMTLYKPYLHENSRHTPIESRIFFIRYTFEGTIRELLDYPNIYEGHFGFCPSYEIFNLNMHYLSS